MRAFSCLVNGSRVLRVRFHARLVNKLTFIQINVIRNSVSPLRVCNIACAERFRVSGSAARKLAPRKRDPFEQRRELRLFSKGDRRVAR
jgi:hypothetical protein